jgi:hypothetical protein
MYRDNSLMPKEALRLAVLGTLIQGGAMRYADLASAVRHFLDRVTGPSLDLMGTSLEMLRYEGLVEARDGTGMEDNALLAPTADGRGEFDRLMRASIRAPSMDGFNKLVMMLKLRFIHLLDEAARREQVDGLMALLETELVRLDDLRRHMEGAPGHLGTWLAHDVAEVRGRLAWFQELMGRV